MRVMSLAVALLVVVPVAARAQSALPLKHLPQPTVPAITAADLMTRLYIYADDSMMGRRAGTPANLRATAYLASQAQRMGLVPAGDHGSYFQNVPLVRESTDSTSTLTAGGHVLKVFGDFVPRRLGTGTPRSLDGVQAVYGGPLDRADAFPATEARGRLVVFSPPRAPAARVNQRALIRRFGDAAGLAVTGLERIPARFLARLREPRIALAEPAGAGGALTVLQITTAAAQVLLGGPLDSLRPGALGPAIGAHLVMTAEPAPARNVVAMVRGRDPALRGEYVAIGAHNDHLGVGVPVDHDSIRIFNHLVRPEGADDRRNQPTPEQQAEVDRVLAAFRAAHPGADRPDSVYNGADDDGSGTVSVLEIAQRIASLRAKPRRSVLFVWHTGEELGLLGSRWFTDHPTVPRDSIVAQLNIDMIGRGDSADLVGRTKDGRAFYGNPRFLALVGSRRLSTELGDLVERVNTGGHHDLDLNYDYDAPGHPANVYCRSDHYSYARYGIPIVFFTTGLHEDYHQVTDEPEYIDYAHMARVARFIEDVAVHVADLDHRVVVDHPKPDPEGDCRQ